MFKVVKTQVTKNKIDSLPGALQINYLVDKACNAENYNFNVALLGSTRFWGEKGLLSL